jgi:hypothetical protein
MIFARQSTAIIVTVGPVLDADGVAVTDGVVGDFVISKNGAAPAALNASATLTHRNTGHYSLSLTATDVNTVGTAEVVINDTVNACPMKEITVVEPATYDVLFADAAPGPASPTNITAGTVTTTTNVTTVNGLAANVITATSIANDAITAAKIANAAIDAATFAADVDAEILSYIVDDATRIDASALNTASVTTIPAILVDTAEIGAAGAGLTALATQASVNTIDGIVDAILLDTAEIGAAGAGLTALATQASVNTIDGIVDSILLDTAEIGAAGAGLTAINLPDQTMNITGDITGNLSGSVGSVTGAVGSVTGAVGSVTGAVGSVTGLTASDVGAIKTQTDKFVFTVANQVDANIQYVNDVAVTGDGQAGTEWGP